MEENSNIKDFGEITVPTSWKDISLRKFQEIERYYGDKDRKFDIREVVHILIDKDIDYVNSLPLSFLESISEKLEFLSKAPEEKEPINSIVIDGERYFINMQSKLKVGEYVAADTVMKGDKHNFAALLAILCRKDGEVYDSHFENEVVEERVRMFEEQPILDVLPLCTFFLGCWEILQMPSLLSLKARELIDLTRSNGESLARDGEISRRCMRSVNKRLKKLEKYINSI